MLFIFDRIVDFFVLICCPAGIWNLTLNRLRRKKREQNVSFALAFSGWLENYKYFFVYLLLNNNNWCHLFRKNGILFEKYKNKKSCLMRQTCWTLICCYYLFPFINSFIIHRYSKPSLWRVEKSEGHHFFAMFLLAKKWIEDEISVQQTYSPAQTHNV
jgi:hypothetical protein